MGVPQKLRKGWFLCDTVLVVVACVCLAAAIVCVFTVLPRCLNKSPSKGYYERHEEPQHGWFPPPPSIPFYNYEDEEYEWRSEDTDDWYGGGRSRSNSRSSSSSSSGSSSSSSGSSSSSSYEYEYDYNYWDWNSDVMATECHVVTVHYAEEPVKCVHNPIGEWCEEGRFGEDYDYMMEEHYYDRKKRSEPWDDDDHPRPPHSSASGGDMDGMEDHHMPDWTGMGDEDMRPPPMHDEPGFPDDDMDWHTDDRDGWMGMDADMAEPGMMGPMPEPGMPDPDITYEDYAFRCGAVGVQYADPYGDMHHGVLHQSVDMEDNFPQCTFASCYDDYDENLQYLDQYYEPYETYLHHQETTFTCYYYSTRPEVLYIEEPEPFEWYTSAGFHSVFWPALVGVVLVFVVIIRKLVYIAKHRDNGEKMNQVAAPPPAYTAPPGPGPHNMYVVANPYATAPALATEKPPIVGPIVEVEGPPMPEVVLNSKELEAALAGNHK